MKIRYINIVFIILTIIYTICSFSVFFDPYDEGIILGISYRIYLIGYIIFVLSKILNKKKELSTNIFFVTSIITVIATLINLISLLYDNSIGAGMTIVLYNTLPSFLDKSLIFLSFVQKILITILIYKCIKQNKTYITPYLLVIITFAMDILSFFQEISIEYCFLTIINIYIALYLFYNNRGLTSKSYKHILSIIVITLLVIFMLISSVSWIPVVKINNIVGKIEKIDSITSTNSITKQQLNYKDYKNVLTYNISNNINETYRYDDGSLYTYTFENISITVVIQELDEMVFKNWQKMITNFYKDNRKYYIVKNSKRILILTNIRDDLYYTVQLHFNQNVSISKTKLENLKPFLDINFNY